MTGFCFDRDADSRLQKLFFTGDKLSADQPVELGGDSTAAGRELRPCPSYPPGYLSEGHPSAHTFPAPSLALSDKSKCSPKARASRAGKAGWIAHKSTLRVSSARDSVKYIQQKPLGKGGCGSLFSLGLLASDAGAATHPAQHCGLF